MSFLPHRKVLICDDLPFLREALARTIKKCWPNSEITEAKNGLIGEQIAKNCDFDVIFMDVEMPVQNGLVTLENLRKQKLAEGTPIVVCTGCKGGNEEANERLSAFTYKVEKPFDPEEIVRILKEIELGPKP